MAPPVSAPTTTTTSSSSAYLSSWLTIISSGGGPLLRLQLYGCLCRCLEKEEDTSARQALQYVNRLGRHIQWVVDDNDNNNNNNNDSGSGSRRLVQHAIKNMAWLGSSLFGSNENNNNNNNNKNDPSESHTVSGNSPNLTTWNGTAAAVVRARLYARDGMDGEPELWIEQQQQKQQQQQRSHGKALQEANAVAEVLAPQPPSNEEKAPCVVPTSTPNSSSLSFNGMAMTSQENRTHFPLLLSIRLAKDCVGSNHLLSLLYKAVGRR